MVADQHLPCERERPIAVLEATSLPQWVPTSRIFSGAHCDGSAESFPFQHAPPLTHEVSSIRGVQTCFPSAVVVVVSADLSNERSMHSIPASGGYWHGGASRRPASEVAKYDRMISV